MLYSCFETSFKIHCLEHIRAKYPIPVEKALLEIKFQKYMLILALRFQVLERGETCVLYEEARSIAGPGCFNTERKLQSKDNSCFPGAVGSSTFVSDSAMRFSKECF